MEIKGYKGFNPGLICKGKQYAENTTFEETEASICQSGMHFCQNPMDVWEYYPIVNKDGEFNEFAEVTADGDTKVDGNKSCTTKLHIGAKLSFGSFVKACVDFLVEKTKPENTSSGYFAKIGSSGDYAQIGSSGDYAQIGSSGDYAQIGSSGGYAQIGSSGDYAQIGSSGDYAQIGSSGDSAKIGSSGYYAQIGSSGENSVICCAGHNSRVKAKVGSWITLSEWERQDDEYIPVCVKTEKVDGERIKEDTWYTLKNGEFVEVQNG